MKTIILNVYKFNELSEDVQQKVIDKYYENKTYAFLSEDLTESCKEYLKENDCNYSGIKLYYSLSNCQGDGLCFIGEVEKNGKRLKLSHNSRYCHAHSVNMEFYDENGDETDEIQELKNIYFDICKKLEDEGYSIIEYRMDTDEFLDISESNNWEYYEDGEML